MLTLNKKNLKLYEMKRKKTNVRDIIIFTTYFGN